MRYIKDLLIEKVVLQVITGESIKESKELSINENVEHFVRKHIIKSLRSNNTFKVALNNDSSLKTLMCRLVDDPASFLDVVTDISNSYTEVSHDFEDPYCDLLFVQYIGDERRSFAMLKLDYKKSYHHFESGDDYNLGLANVLPGTGVNLSKCLFFSKSKDLEVIAINKDNQVEEKYIFSKKFLEGYFVNDDVSRTRKIKSVVEKWINMKLNENIRLASRLRDGLVEYLINEDKFSIEDFKGYFDDESLFENFYHHLSQNDLHKDFRIDKTFVDRNLSSRSIKTDTGYTIKASAEAFRDNQHFCMIKNLDGSMDYVFKNIRSIREH